MGHLWPDEAHALENLVGVVLGLQDTGYMAQAVESLARKVEVSNYHLFLTAQQMACSHHVFDQLNSDASSDEPMTAVHTLVVSCLAPEDLDPVARSKYIDITHVFVVLKAVKKDSSYCSLSQMVCPTTAMQYIFHAVLLDEAHLSIALFDHPEM